MSTPRIVYVVFDRYPAPKGAAIHIGAFSKALASAFAPVALLTVGDEAVRDADATFEHFTLPAAGANILARAAAYRSSIGRWLAGRGRMEAIHFRSIFEGYPLARYKNDLCDKLVFEVNGLPSIELKYHYPKVAEDRELLAKLRAQEQVCIEAADLIITVSEVTREHLVARGAVREKIRVIPNGVDLGLFSYRAPRPLGSTACLQAMESTPLVASNPCHPTEKAVEGGSSQSLRLIYCGTLAAWQGVYRAIEAMELIRKEYPATLMLVGPASQQRRGELVQRCDELGITGHVSFLDPVDQHALCRLHHEADIALAPLLRNDRNMVQGCCPLKVLEAMAAGTPVVASDLPVVSALARNEDEALLVRPGSPKAIKDAVLRLVREPGLGLRLSRAARACVEERFTWEIAAGRLIEVYEEVLGMTPSRIRERAAASTCG